MRLIRDSMIAIAIGVYLVIFVAVLGIFCAAGKGKPWPLPAASDVSGNRSIKFSMNDDPESEQAIQFERDVSREPMELRNK